MGAAMDPEHATMRLVRGGLLALCCVLLGMSGHTLGGGTSPAAVPALIASALIGGAAVAWAGRRRDFGPLLLAAAEGQVLFHLILTSAPTGMSHHGLSLRMLAAHAVATVVMAAVLARGEAVLDALYRSLRQFVLLPGPGPVLVVTTPPRLSVRPPEPSDGEVGLRFAAATPYRGPPRVPPVRTGVING